MSKKNLSKRIQELLVTATPKQKALLVCKQYTDRNTTRRKALLSDDEVIALRESLKTNEEKREYNKWINVYNVYNDFTPIFGIVFKEYQAIAERILGYLRQWEAYNQEENHLITIYEGIKEAKDKNAEKAYLTSLSHLYFEDAKLVIAEDGYPEIDITALYERIQEQSKQLYNSYAVAKSMVIVMDEYTKKTRSKDFRPDVMIDAIKQIKGDYAQIVAPKYSRKLLKERIDKGMRITLDEMKRAVYPSYEEIQPTEADLELFRERLNEIVVSYAKRR